MLQNSTSTTVSTVSTVKDGRRWSKVPTAPVNIMQRMSIGLPYVYAGISLRWQRQKERKSGISSEPSDADQVEESPRTMEDGRLQLPSNDPSSEPADSTNEEGEMPWFAGRFRYARLLGEGAFAQTVLAEDMYHPQRRRIAIKVQNALYNVIGEEESKRITQLNDADPEDVCHMIRLITTFTYGSHFCIAFELLEPKPLSIPHRLQSVLPAEQLPDHRLVERCKLNMIRKLAYQLMVALCFLHKHDLIHADLKPENILFRADQSYHVKLIDFGNAFSLSEASLYFETFEVQSLHYRAPEVILGVPFDSAIDMWAMGILLCEAWMGKHMFSADTPALLVREMIQIFGCLPRAPFVHGKNFFAHYCDRSFIRVEGAELFNMDEEQDRIKFRLRRLSEVLNTRDFQFLHFLLDVLEYDPQRRLTPDQALRHPFFRPMVPMDLLSSGKQTMWKHGSDAVLSATDRIRDLLVINSSPVPASLVAKPMFHSDLNDALQKKRRRNGVTGNSSS